jgi:hypothetical protein
MTQTVTSFVQENFGHRRSEPSAEGLSYEMSYESRRLMSLAVVCRLHRCKSRRESPFSVFPKVGMDRIHTAEVVGSSPAAPTRYRWSRS